MVSPEHPALIASVLHEPRRDGTPWARVGTGLCPVQAERSSATSSVSASAGLQNRPVYLFHRPSNLLRRNHCRRRNQQVVARDAVHASLHGIDQQPAPETCLAHQSGEILLRREGSLRLLVSNEFDAPQQTQAADIANRIQIAQTLQRLLQSRASRSLSIRIGGVHKILR